MRVRRMDGRVGAIAAAIAALAGGVVQAAPATFVLVHSGRLLDEADQPITSPAKRLGFRIYDRSLPVLAQQLVWEAACDVRLERGFYGVALGGECGAPLDAVQFPAGADRFLELTVDGVAITPRLRLATAPRAGVASRALSSDRLGGLDPSAYALATHTHTPAEITSFGSLVTSAVAQGGVRWEAVADRPDVFVPSAHGHAALEITGLDTALAGRAAGGHGHAPGDIAGLEAALAAKLSGEADPKIGTLGDGKWCSAQGGVLSCVADPPQLVGRQVDSGASPRRACAPAAAGVLWFDTGAGALKICNGQAYAAVKAF